jgi:hypothetical protein
VVPAAWPAEAGACGTGLDGAGPEAEAGARVGAEADGCPPPAALALPLSQARQQPKAMPATIAALVSAVAFRQLPVAVSTGDLPAVLVPPSFM